VYWACAAVLASKKAATANSFLIIISWAGGTPIPIPILHFGSFRKVTYITLEI
jgi:hypothetical protein